MDKRLAKILGIEKLNIVSKAAESDPEAPSIPDWVATLQAFKETLIQQVDSTSTPPVVFIKGGPVIGDDFIIAVYRSDRIHAEDSLSIFTKLYLTFSPDVGAVMMDAFITSKQAEGLPPNPSTEDENDAAIRTINDRYNAGDAGIKRGLLMYRIDRTARVESAIVPFLYGGHGTRMIWFRSEYEYKDLCDSDDGIPEAWRDVVSLQTIPDLIESGEFGTEEFRDEWNTCPREVRLAMSVKGMLEDFPEDQYGIIFLVSTGRKADF